MPDSDGVPATLRPREPVQGAVQGLCTAGATGLALCGAFLGYWGFQGQGDWQFIHLAVFIPLFLGAGAFGFTPFLVTSSHGEAKGRRVYLAALVIMFSAMIAALAISYSTPAEREDRSLRSGTPK